MLRALVAIMMLVSLAPRAAHAQRFAPFGVTDKEGLRFFAALQGAVASGNRAAVVSMVNYPLQVSRNHTNRSVIANAAEMTRQYNAIFTPFIRSAITSEKAEDLFVGDNGIAIKRGVVWLNGACNKARPPVCHLGVSSVNLP